MQDPPVRPRFPEEEQLKCPRCESMNTKFCYYNNYNLSQPRHFCKNCRRYWTNGGALRNIPVGGGTRKNTSKRSSTSKRVNSDPGSEPVNLTGRIPAAGTAGQVGLDDPTRRPLDVAMGGKFSSLLESHGRFGNIFEDLGPNGSGLKMADIGGFDDDLSSGSNSNGWADPAIYSPRF